MTLVLIVDLDSEQMRTEEKMKFLTEKWFQRCSLNTDNVVTAKRSQCPYVGMVTCLHLNI